MNNQLTTFNFEGSNVQVIKDKNNEPLFFAKDVCAILGYVNVSKTISDHCKEAGVTKRYISSESGAKQTIFINEGNLYRLVIKSNKPEAERFESWVCDEVLVSIRKTGNYSVNPAPNLNDPALLRTLLLDNVNKVIELQSTIEEQAPKVAALDFLSGSEGSLCLTDTAKTLKIPRHNLITYLSTERYIYKRGGVGNWIAHQNRIESGLLEHRSVSIPRSDGTETNKSQVIVIPKGLTKLAVIFSSGAGDSK